jgi:NADPH2:quinone reductase
MRAIRCNQYGPPESLAIEELPDLTPQAGEVVIDVKAASVNFPDVLIIQNKYQFKPPLPFTPGSEVAGIVRSVGAGVTQFQPGSRVVAFTGQGGFAEQAVAGEGRLRAACRRHRLRRGGGLHACLWDVAPCGG